mgnify:CR=1 FL=1
MKVVRGCLRKVCFTHGVLSFIHRHYRRLGDGIAVVEEEGRSSLHICWHKDIQELAIVAYGNYGGEEQTVCINLTQKEAEILEQYLRRCLNN